TTSASKMPQPQLDFAQQGRVARVAETGRGKIESVMGEPMRSILLAEDDDSMRRFLEKALERAGYRVSAYANGAEAYEGLKEQPYTLLLTDIVMPEMD